MKIKDHSSRVEEEILTAMIVSDSVLSRLSCKWDGEMFTGKFANIAGAMCVKFFEEHNTAPKANIESLFRSWAERRKNDAETVQEFETYLSALSGDYERIGVELNPDHVLDVARQHFNRVRYRRHAQAILDDIESGRDEHLSERLTSFSEVSIGEQAATDLFNDPSAIRAAFEDDEKPIIEYPGDLGKFFSHSMERDGLLAFIAPEKAGKTWWLIDVGYRAASQRRKVAFFECGDMSKKQVSRRFGCRVSRRPYRSRDGNWPCSVKYPVAIYEPEEFKKPAHVDFEEREFDTKLTAKEAEEAFTKFQRTKVKSKDSYFKLWCYPNDTVTVAMIEAELKSWDRQGWCADVVIVDYADILAMPTGKLEMRDAINKTWKQLRKLSQKRHCLVVTATQADSASYEKDLMDRRNFSEDKRKLSHASGIVGINVTSAEKELGLTRLNWIVLREGEFSVKRVCHVAGCLDVGCPAILSTFPQTFKQGEVRV